MSFAKRFEFALHSGYVFTPDAKRIFVNAQALATCYDLPAGSWIRWDHTEDRPWADFIHLYPCNCKNDYPAALDVALREAAGNQRT